MPSGALLLEPVSEVIVADFGAAVDSFETVSYSRLESGQNIFNLGVGTMRGVQLIASLFFVFVSTIAVNAAPLAGVELLQAPAWLIRDDVRMPMAIGAELKENDRIETAANARVILRLGEDSRIKIGEASNFSIALIDDGKEIDGVFIGFFDVLKGAFRFTTTAIGKLRERDMAVQLGTVTIGIRGTDVWGKAEDARDFVVLLEGKVEIDREGESFKLDEPQSLFMARHGATPDPIGPVNAEDLAMWAQETEPQTGAGVQKIGGRVVLHLPTYTNEASARALIQRLGEAGYSAMITKLEVGGRNWFHVSQPNFASREDANSARAALQSLGGLGGAWLEQE